MSIKGYKVFNSDFTCRGFQFEVGKTYKHDGNIELCSSGFHFCRRASDCFNFYPFNPNNRVAEVEAIGLVKTSSDGVKSVTDEITIIREVSWHEVLELVNTGKNCTGLCNSGNRNSGNRNSGNWNSGDCNSGICNLGDWNSGDCNLGNWNSGNCNSGNCNSGNYNPGNCNSGAWNLGDWNSGFFNTITPNLIVFNKPLDMTREEFNDFKGVLVLERNYENTWWICSENMTTKEKEEHPEHEYMGGYLKVVDFKTACKMMWDNLDEDDRKAVKEIPNFDPDVFKDITGIDVTE